MCESGFTTAWKCYLKLDLFGKEGYIWGILKNPAWDDKRT